MCKKSDIILWLAVLVLMGCSDPNVEDKKKLSDAEQWSLDSISKVRQREMADSMKQKNPLLIMPPDSTYTGEYTDKYPNGIVKFKGFFRFGKRHGQWLSFFPNGLMWSELHYDKGMREGPNFTFMMSGNKLYKGFYKNDMKDSVWCFYDSTGKINKRVMFKKDIIVAKLPLKE